MGWSGLSSEDVFKYGLVGLVASLVLGAPQQVLQSLKRWLGDPPARPAPRTTPPSASQLTTRLKRLMRPTLLLVPATAAGLSKLGGDPELPPDLAWPAGYERPQEFLAQIDLGAVSHNAMIDWLPKEGRIYAFYDPDGQGCTNIVRVLFSTDPAGSPVVPPAGVRRRFLERRVAFVNLTSAPSLEWLDLDSSEIDIDEEAFEGLTAIASAPPSDNIQHRIGGYPNEIQDECMPLSCEHLARGLPDRVWGEEVPPAIRRSSKTWRMLLQMDSDPALKMTFGDGGRLYVFIREKHARAGDFSNTVTLWQTY